ncbi:MAG: universal stress protein [Deltaproteobacteria bacterium]|nr:universal stress protein [Deltaproteobacteria bacterium]MBW1957722.1 universal stress protein [Deltaproteobacteria bacterium]MBW2012728.1 universal stress protein [Deltaproteobacteria bacterium]MBW2088948.1 universal stress protein [Deltaproteobacteria bacterium]MBW2320426.1 universal stress protein [Deltaproteobacteria bacterium]
MEIKKILCPVDFSEISANALEYAVFLASHHHAELLLLHVVEHLHEFEHYQILVFTPQELSEKMEEHAYEALNKLAEPIKETLKVETVIRQGKAFVEIIKEATEKDMDLIVMGSHGRTGISHMLMGSVTEKVVRKANCPVLVFRGKNTQFDIP